MLISLDAEKEAGCFQISHERNTFSFKNRYINNLQSFSRDLAFFLITKGKLFSYEIDAFVMRNIKMLLPVNIQSKVFMIREGTVSSN